VHVLRHRRNICPCPLSRMMMEESLPNGVSIAFCEQTPSHTSNKVTHVCSLRLPHSLRSLSRPRYHSYLRARRELSTSIAAPRLALITPPHPSSTHNPTTANMKITFKVPLHHILPSISANPHGCTGPQAEQVRHRGRAFGNGTQTATACIPAAPS
jgi:hypothetical protein